nr:TPA_asm: N [Pogostemom alphacytorhabdovirus 1_Pog]
MAGQMTEAEFQKAIQAARAKKIAKGVTINPQLLPSTSQEPNTKEVKTKLLTAGSSKYRDLDDVSVGKLTSSRWSDNDLNTIHVYRVTRLSAAKCITLGGQLIASLENGNISSHTADICLALALSLAKPAVNNFEWLLDPITGEMGISTPFNQPDVSDVGGGLSATETAMMQRAREKLPGATTEEEINRFTSIIRRLEAKEKGSAENLQAINEFAATSYCFLAAFIMKLNGKSEDSFIESLQMMRLRYSAWYEGESTVLRSFNPSMDTVRALRVVFTRRPELLSTWILTIAYNENKVAPLTITQQGLLNYLACQQYAYYGMHAYTLLLSIHEATGLKLGTLLKEMDCPVTRAGVRAAFDLIKDHEITSKFPNRKTYFRYARVWNSKYFSALQSSNCTTLVYVTAKVSKITSSQKAGGDPLEIYAIKNMDDVIKARLDKVATRLASMILDTMLIDEESGSAWNV